METGLNGSDLEPASRYLGENQTSAADGSACRGEASE